MSTDRFFELLITQLRNQLALTEDQTERTILQEQLAQTRANLTQLRLVTT